MFVLTLGDIIGLLLLLVAVVYIIYLVSVFVSSRDKPKRQDAEVETKKDGAPKKPKPATRGDKIAYAVAILILIIVFFLWRFAHDNGL